MRRVVITGAGVVTPFGCDVEGFWNAVRAGQPAARALDQSAAVHGIAVGAPVQGFSPRAFIDPKQLRLMAPAVAFGVAAADLAVKDSGLALEAMDPGRVGAFIGSRGHSSDRQDLLPAVQLASASGAFRLDVFGAKGLPLVHPMWLLKGLANNVLYFVSLKYNAQGMNNNLSLGGVAGTMAIGEAFDAIRRGYVDAAIVSAYDSALDADRIEMFGNAGLATRASDPTGAGRPFDRQRDGFVSGEGAGAVILESLDAARARGARLYAEVRGYGCATSPHGRSELGPSARGFELALSTALADAGAVPSAVFAHGLATRVSDEAETQGMKAALGDATAHHTPMPAIKSMIGNTFAASGTLEAIVAALALRDRTLPPTINLTDPDPACDLDYVAGAAREAALETVALNNANLGGGHAALVLGKA